MAEDDGLVVCSKCGGTGECIDDEILQKIDIATTYLSEIKKSCPCKITVICGKCGGSGKLDWVDNITNLQDSFLQIKIDFLGDNPRTLVFTGEAWYEK